MMNSVNVGARASVLIALTCVVLAGCGSKNKTPTGQVVANVDGQEVTIRELKTEMGTFSTSDPKIMKSAEQTALRAIVNRKLLAKAAIDQKLDKSADYGLQKQRAVEFTLVQALQANITKSVPASTREEAEHYISAHPNAYAERKIMKLDQVQTPLPMSSEMAAKLQPLETIEQVIATLSAANIPTNRVTSQLDGAVADPGMVDQVLKLPSSGMFTVPQGNLLTINKVVSVRTEPFTGEPAIKAAMARLQGQHTNEALQRSITQLIGKGMPKVKYAKGYEPPQPKPAAAAPGANAPATK